MEMKKIISKTILLTAIFFASTGCSGVFDDLAVNPNQPSITELFSTPEGVDKAVKTCYGYISTQRLFGASASKTLIIRSDEASSNSDYGKPGMYGSELHSSYYTLIQPFALLYSCASQGSFVIDNIDDVEFSDNKLKNAYKGEAYFWRAFSHYYLLMSYRKVAPVRHTPLGAEDYIRKAEPADVVWDFIVEDLKKAIELLPHKGYWSADQAGRVTAASASALLGKSYLYRSGIEPLYGTTTTTFYNEAAAAFSAIIDGTYGDYSLVEYAHNFDVANENNNESILEIQFLGDVNNTSFNPGNANSGLGFDGRGIMFPGTGVGYEGVVHEWLYDDFVKSIDADGFTDIRMFSTMLFNDLDPEIKLRPGQRLTGPGDYHFEDYYPKGNFSTAGNTRSHRYKAAILKGLDTALPMRGDTPTNIAGVGGGTKEMIYNQPRAHGANWRYIRYADVLLMYAEAVVSGGAQGSISAGDAYNQVRNRANMSIKGAITLQDIKEERKLELALEGHRYFDLLRWGEVKSRFDDLGGKDENFKNFIADGNYKGFISGKNEWLPIPIDEMESNPLAEQNPGY